MGVKELGYVVIETAQPDAWDHFLTQTVGVMRAGEVAGAAHYRLDDRAFRFRIQPGESDRLLAAAYQVEDAAALASLSDAIAAAGRPVTQGSGDEAAARGVSAFFKSSDPAGNGLEFYCGDTRDQVVFVSPAGVSGFVTGKLGMGHAVFSALNFDETHAFYTQVIGLANTDLPRFHLMGGPDDPGIRFAFMHADNGRHHSLAIGEMPGPPSGCVHLMLEMKTMMDVGKCYDRMRLNKVPESASLGHHMNDEMTSFYMQTPGGFDIEIGCDGLVIDPANWETTAHDKISDWGHVWAWQKAMAEAQG
jgi:3,4-dihydroxy-9,10-secoandrosta-1,3,5(10)-triene-9,17-dione 4,5-dioxygenase